MSLRWIKTWEHSLQNWNNKTPKRLGVPNCIEPTSQTTDPLICTRLSDTSHTRAGRVRFFKLLIKWNRNETLTVLGKAQDVANSKQFLLLVTDMKNHGPTRNSRAIVRSWSVSSQSSGNRRLDICLVVETSSIWTCVSRIWIRVDKLTIEHRDSNREKLRMCNVVGFLTNVIGMSRTLHL